MISTGFILYPSICKQIRKLVCIDCCDKTLIIYSVGIKKIEFPFFIPGISVKIIKTSPQNPKLQKSSKVPKSKHLIEAS